MPTNRPNINRNQTLLILLGILLACLLTFNATASHSTGALLPKEKGIKAIEKPMELNGKIHSATVGFIKSFAKNLHL